MKFFLACPRGLEALLADELLAMGASRAAPAVSGVQAEGEPALAYRATMFSRLCRMTCAVRLARCI